MMDMGDLSMKCSEMLTLIEEGQEVLLKVLRSHGLVRLPKVIFNIALGR
jgi:hypothetical protein